MPRRPKTEAERRKTHKKRFGTSKVPKRQYKRRGIAASLVKPKTI